MTTLFQYFKHEVGLADSRGMCLTPMPPPLITETNHEIQEATGHKNKDQALQAVQCITPLLFRLQNFPSSCLPNLSIVALAKNAAEVFQTPSINRPLVHKRKCNL